MEEKNHLLNSATIISLSLFLSKHISKTLFRCVFSKNFLGSSSLLCWSLDRRWRILSIITLSLPSFFLFCYLLFLNILSDSCFVSHFFFLLFCLLSFTKYFFIFLGRARCHPTCYSRDYRLQRTPWHCNP